MTPLSITTAWNETAAFARREAHLLFPIAFLLMSLPGAIVQATMPVTEPGAIPETGVWLALVPFAVLFSLIGALAVSHLALQPGASVGEALGVGARRFAPLLAAAILLGLGGALLLLPLLFLVAAVAVATGNPQSPLAALVPLLVLPFFLYVWARVMLMTPAAAVEKIGPVAMIRRSWELTRGQAWKLLGFLLIVILVSLVTMAAIQAVGGIVITLVAGPPRPGSVAMFLILLVQALVQAAVSGLFATFIARIYAQLSGFGLADLFGHSTKGS